MKISKKMMALLLALMMVLSLTACGGNKDALAGTWSADLGDDGVITWMFDGKGKCTMENAYMKQDGTYSIEDDQLTVTLESWNMTKKNQTKHLKKQSVYSESDGGKNTRHH